MAEESGHTARTLAEAAAALDERDAGLAAADGVLTEVLRSAYEAGVDSVRRLDAVRAEIDAAASLGPAPDPAAAGEVARFLLSKNRDIRAVVAQARAVAEAKTLVLQELADRY